MAALIASPKNTSHRMSCLLMEKLKTLKKVSLCCVSCQFFYIMRFKKYHKEKKICFSFLQKKVNLNKKKGQKQNRRTGVCSLCGGDPYLLIHNSQFITVQTDTDYRHMICLGFAPVFFF